MTLAIQPICFAPAPVNTAFGTVPHPAESASSAELMFGSGLPRSEAISLPDMVHAVCTELRPLLAHHQVSLLFNGDARALPLVFGHRDKLRTALWECVEAAVVHARLALEPDRSLAMELLFSTDADQVHLTIRSLGAIEEVTLASDGSAAPATADSTSGAIPANEPRQHMVFPFARLLLQSQGGQVVVNQGNDGGMECTLSLPCADDHVADAPLGKHHAQIYAGLLTRLTQSGLINGQHSAC
jgi:hypothetical protein